MDVHKRAVAAIATKVAAFHQHNVPFRLYHGHTNSTRQYKVDPSKMIDTSGLKHVLSIDEEAMSCFVEANVPMDQLVDATLAKGLIPCVVMEFPGITVAGGFAGLAGESSGFKYGDFNGIVQAIEIVIGDGQVLNASPDENVDLFQAAGGTLGTLGVVTALHLKLMPAKRYVEVMYEPITTVQDSLQKLQVATENKSLDYVDGVLLTAKTGFIITGRLTDELGQDIKVQRFTRRHDPWFYTHLVKLHKHAKRPRTEAVPIKDYLFRWDRGSFWTGHQAFQYLHVPFDRGTRFVVDSLMHARTMYQALHLSGLASEYIVQDLLVPRDKALQLIEYVHEQTDIWPLWLCPFALDRKLPLNPHGTDEARSVYWTNVGVWGRASQDRKKFLQLNRNLESKVCELQGIKVLYAQSFYTGEEFDQIYDTKSHEALREKYHASYLPTVYDKVKPDFSKYEPAQHASVLARARDTVWKIWPIKVAYAVVKTIMSDNYLLSKSRPSPMADDGQHSHQELQSIRPEVCERRP